MLMCQSQWNDVSTFCVQHAERPEPLHRNDIAKRSNKNVGLTTKGKTKHRQQKAPTPPPPPPKKKKKKKNPKNNQNQNVDT